MKTNPMKLSSLEKAAKDLTRIKELDTEISKLEKLAMILATNECKVSLNLSIENLTKESKKESILDEDGSIKSEYIDIEDKEEDTPDDFSGYMRRLVTSSILHSYSIGSDKKNNKEVIEYIPSELEAIEVIGVLIFTKQQQRKTLIEKLSKAGFEI